MPVVRTRGSPARTASVRKAATRCFLWIVELIAVQNAVLWRISAHSVTAVQCAVAGFLLAVTPASAQDYDTTRHAAEQGDADAQAARWYRKSAEQGAAAAPVDLGISYNAGVGVPAP